MQAFIEAQRRKDLRPEQTKRDVGNAITDAISKVVGQHYKNKEMKLMQNKADKEKEFTGLIDYLQKNEILKLPAGTTEETKVEGYTQIPSEMQQRLQGQGITAQYSQPREKPIKAEPVIGAAGRKAIFAQIGKDLPEDTPQRLAQSLISQYGMDKRATTKANLYSKTDPAYRALTDMVKDLPGVPIEAWTPKDKANYDAWLKKTKEKGITIEDIATINDAPPEEQGFWNNLMGLIGWKKPVQAGIAKPVVKPVAQPTTIRVRIGDKTGTINASDFDPKTMVKI